MKKEYMNPLMEIYKLQDDVVTASGDNGSENDGYDPDKSETEIVGVSF